MSDDGRLIGISLAGFQVFEELTEIPLGRLSLLYGPNSAGKSVVEDALTLIRDLWFRNDNYWVEDDGKRRQLLKRHWRCIDAKDSLLSPKLVLGAKFDVPIQELVRAINSHSEKLSQLPAIAGDRTQLELRLTYIDARFPVEDNGLLDGGLLSRTIKKIDILLDGYSLISFCEPGEAPSCCVIHLNHPLFSTWRAHFLKGAKVPTKLRKHISGRATDGEWKISEIPIQLTREDFLDVEYILTCMQTTDKHVREYLLGYKDLVSTEFLPDFTVPRNGGIVRQSNAR